MSLNQCSVVLKKLATLPLREVLVVLPPAHPYICLWDNVRQLVSRHADVNFGEAWIACAHQAVDKHGSLTYHDQLDEMNVYPIDTRKYRLQTKSGQHTF